MKNSRIIPRHERRKLGENLAITIVGGAIATVVGGLIVIAIEGSTGGPADAPSAVELPPEEEFALPFDGSNFDESLAVAPNEVATCYPSGQGIVDLERAASLLVEEYNASPVKAGRLDLCDGRALILGTTLDEDVPKPDIDASMLVFPDSFGAGGTNVVYEITTGEHVVSGRTTGDFEGYDFASGETVEQMSWLATDAMVSDRGQIMFLKYDTDDGFDVVISVVDQSATEER